MHYLGHGGANPDDSADAAFRGDTQINCVDGDSNAEECATETYTNDGSSSVVVYFVVKGYNSGENADFTIAGTLENRSTVAIASHTSTPTESPTRGSGIINLKSISSPYTGSTSGRRDDAQVCKATAYTTGGKGQSFWMELPPGFNITIGQTDNNFNSTHYLGNGRCEPRMCTVRYKIAAHAGHGCY
jgi:hypothetical protein